MGALNDLGLSTEWVTCFCLLLARAGGWIVVVPMFGAKGFAMFARSAFTVALALALTPTALAHAETLPDNPITFLAAAIGEVIVGAVIGWVTGLLFSAAEMAGALADMTSGLSFASMVDPATGNNQATFARVFSIVFLAIAFAADAHHQLLAGFASTLDPIAPGVWPTFSAGTLDAVVDAVLALMRAAIEIGAPLIGALFLTEVALGLMSKFYPQANILMIGLGVKAMVAITTTGLALVLLPSKVGPMLETGARTLAQVF